MTISDEQRHAQHILETWLPFLHRSGFTRKELERLDAGVVFYLAGKIIHRETTFPLTDPQERALLIHQSREKATA